jgi:hypothetical protein
LRLIVNRDIGAELAAGIAFLRRARGGDDARPERLGELDGGGADAGRAAVDQQRLAGPQAAALEGIVPDREEGFGDRGGFDWREPARQRQGVALVRLAVFGIAAADHQRHDLIAGLPARCAGTERDDFARDLEAGDVGCARGRRVVPLPLHHVRPVDARRLDLHQHLAVGESRQRARLGHEHLRSAGRTDRDRGHIGRQGRHTRRPPRQALLSVGDDL